MDRHQIVITFKASFEQKALFQELLGSKSTLTFLNEIPSTQRRETLEHADVILSWILPLEIRPEEYPYLQQTSFIQTISAGVDYMPFADLPSHIVIAGNTGAYAVPIAEHVMAMTLTLAKRLCIENQKMRNGEFDQSIPNRLLAGTIAGIIGFGGIGQSTAHLMRAFNIHIYAINQSGISSEPVEFIGTLHDLEHVLRNSDILVISLPLTKQTRGLIGKEQLAWMKSDAILINVARAPLIDEEALYIHAKSHPNFRVGIDVWWTEPLGHGQFRMKYPLLDLPNVLGSPHNSGVVPGSMEYAARQAAENIKHFLEGGKARGIVRREDYIS